jgi:hypothetical protein
MARYHVSEDGTPRICTAQSPESCTARGVDGDGAPHGEFSDAGEARRFAEQVLEDSSANSGLSGVSKEATPGVPRLQDTPAAIIVDNVPPMEGWRKVGDFEDGDNGPHLVGPQGEILLASSTGNGTWDLTDADGSDQGVYGNLEDALEALDEMNGSYEDEGYVNEYRNAKFRASAAATE